MDSAELIGLLVSPPESKVMVEAPAGCGKTHTIASAVSKIDRGRQLILTHTNAGVASLREKLRRLGVSPKAYYVDTLDGWAQRLAASFPEGSGYSESMSWPEKRAAAARVLGYKYTHEIIACTHTGLFVDEYQDCSLTQHELVSKLAEILPCRIFGDPLQAVFEFEKTDPVVDWQQDVCGNFAQIGVLDVPWRWHLDGSSRLLGDWLAQVRETLLQNGSLNLEGAPIDWYQSSADLSNERKACSEKRQGRETVIAICPNPERQHFVTKRLFGFCANEEMECRALLHFAEAVWKAEPVVVALQTIGFVRDCCTGTDKLLDHLETKLSGKRPLDSRSKDSDVQLVADAFRRLVESGSLAEVQSCLVQVQRSAGVVIKRRELWRELLKTLTVYLGSPTQFVALVDAARTVRAQTRMMGRRPERATASRILLIKGLEFDHAVVLDADQLTAKQLYVALSRGRCSLTVVSRSKIVRPRVESVVAKSAGDNGQYCFAFPE